MPRLIRKQPLSVVLFVVALVWVYLFYEVPRAFPKAKPPQTVPIPDIATVDDAPPAPNVAQVPASIGATRKHLVVAAMASDDTSWIRKRLLGWSTSIYISDNPQAPLRPPVNKGREAQVYLSYIIDNYDKLPDVTVFMHGDQYQWHNDDVNYDGATVLSRLQVPYVLEQGYVSLRCVWVLGCPDEVHVDDPREDESGMQKHYRDGFAALFPDKADAVPSVVGATCCAQFAVARWKVLEKPRAEYARIRAWLTDVDLPDAVSGRIMEYAWHMIFGKDPVFCPSAPECYCKVFGMCDLQDCEEDHCPGMYKLPQYATKPADWAPLPEYDSVSYEAQNKALELMIDSLQQG